MTVYDTEKGSYDRRLLLNIKLGFKKKKMLRTPDVCQNNILFFFFNANFRSPCMYVYIYIYNVLYDYYKYNFYFWGTHPLKGYPNAAS